MAKSSSTEHSFRHTPAALYTGAPFEIGDTIPLEITPTGVRRAVPGSCGSCLVSHEERTIPGFYSPVTEQVGPDAVMQITVATGPDDATRQRLTVRFKDCTIPERFDAAFAYAPKEAWPAMKEAFIARELEGRSVQYVGVVEKVKVMTPKGPNGTKGKPKPRKPIAERKPSVVRRYQGVLVKRLEK